MAQTATAADPRSGGASSSTKLSDRELFEIQQCEKIIQLRDAILSGKHPTLKVPPGSNTSVEPLSLQKTAPYHRPGATQSGRKGKDSFVSPAQPISSGRPELNPIFLEKSEQLIKAELQIQRQRLERAIKEEVEQRRAAKTSQAEVISDLDLCDVLSKALVLVQATSAPTADGENLAANTETTSDSLDDSTFYSSRHDTPESHLTSRIRNQSEELQTTNRQGQHEEASQQANKSLPKPSGQTQAPATETYPPRPSETNNQATVIPPLASQMSIVPGLNNYVQATVLSSGPSQSASRVTSQSGDQGRVDVGASTSHMVPSNAHNPNDTYFDSHPPSPLVRNHALQPVAPQPTHPSALSALATSSAAIHEVSTSSGHRSAVGTPAQVAALRTEPNIVTSPDSSSQGGKKKGKKKKRKADRQAPESEAAPYIKPEPRSPSPLTAPSYLRPTKRQRHDQQPAAGIHYEPRYEPTTVHGDGVQYITRQYREEPIPVGFARPAALPQPPTDLRYHSGEYYDVRQVRSEDLGPRSAQVEHPAIPYATRATPISRPVSQVMVTDPYPAPPRQHREYHDGFRMTAHPEGETFIAPPRAAPARILVDAYGREYIEPPHHAPSRLAAASPSRHGEHEVVYERLPPRAVSRHPAPGPYEDGSVIYTAPSPAYVMPRRVVTQPEYATHDYRDVRQREFSTRPPPTQGEFVQVLAPQERRHVEDSYGPRQSSSRPMDAVRYQLPPDYGRVHSVRPEAQGPTEFRPSVHPDGHREVLQPYVREYRSGPVPEPVVQRGFSVRPGDRPPNNHIRGGEEVAFIERPRGATQEIVYADDGRREVYR